MKDSADKLTKIYIKMRNAIREKEDEIKTIKKQQETVVEKLLALCEEQDLDSLRTSSGTVSRRVQSTTGLAIGKECTTSSRSTTLSTYLRNAYLA
jgi:predicted HicB family RNase H-like nuclease